VEILAQSSADFAIIIFRALIYWAHRAVVPALAWHLVLSSVHSDE